MMSAADVLEVLQSLAAASVDVWLDGGWGVDALLEKQTRSHDDLDLVMKLQDAEAATRALAALGFTLSEEELPTRFVLRDPNDRRIDFHTVTFDEGGGGVQQLQDGSSYRYPPAGFLASGKVEGTQVSCLSAEVQMECHVGYEPDDADRHDVLALHERFGLELPDIYRSSEAGVGQHTPSE